MNEQYFFVRNLGLGKEVVRLSLVVTEVSRGGVITVSIRVSRYHNVKPVWMILLRREMMEVHHSVCTGRMFFLLPK